MWVSDPAVAVTVRVVVAWAAVESAARITVCCEPEERLKLEGEAVTPAGIPVTAMPACAANPLLPVTPTVTEFEDPAATETLAGCNVRVKSEGALTPRAIWPA